MIHRLPLVLFSVAILVSHGRSAAGPVGYYRHPAVHGETILFVAEGDLWKVSSRGGVAARLTSHAGMEMNPVLSRDGSTVAFTAQYEGPTEIYTMPAEGGLPTRWTYDGARCNPAAFAPDGRLVYVTQRYAGLPNYQAVLLDLHDGARERVPLSQIADAAFSDDGGALFFERFPFQGSHTKRYRGGTAQDIWRFDPATGQEARSLTGDHPGTDRSPMFWQGRLYFVSDRDGAMNVWSMTPDGSDKRQHTHNVDWDMKDAALSEGRIVYQLGAGIRVFDIAGGDDREIPITLDTDLDQAREKWIDKPWKWLTSAHVSPSGDRAVLTARGQVFVAPQGEGRLVEATRGAGVRYRDARFNADGTGILALSDESGEVEFWSLPASGIGEREQITRGAEVLRWEGIPSPDGKRVAHHDKNHVLWMTTLRNGETIRVDANTVDDLSDLTWSPDSRWLAYVAIADNFQRRIRIYEVEGGRILDATSDRYESYSPAWGADGKRLYFLSDRSLHSVVRSVWGARQPDPFYDRTARIYELSLVPGLRSPFEADNELVKGEEKDTAGDKERAGKKDGDESASEKPPRVTIEAHGLATRLYEVPISPGDYTGLFIAGDRLYWLSQPDRHAPKLKLVSAPMRHRDLEVATVVDSLQSAERSADGKKILVRTGDALYVIEAGSDKKADLDDKAQVDLSRWSFSLDPREEWRQMFIEAWRLERDYFYDPNMHGVDWPAVREKYQPLVERVSDRAELSDLLGQMVSELSALHIFVYGGDARSGSDDIQTADLGAELERDVAAGGYRVTRVTASDPDRPSLASPLALPGVDVKPGDVIVSVNGERALDAPEAGALLRRTAGRQVLLQVRPQGSSDLRSVIVTPLTSADASDRRYHEWEYTRRLEVERLGDDRIGYVHLRAMGGDDMDQWVREFYPVFDKEGLIIDVRHNRGGNIESWILGKLLRKAWFWWQPRGGAPYSDMQFAFNGHVTVLCDESTASDGEAFAEGIRRLGLGKVIGTRTWGGEIWLSSSNLLVDRGIATAAESGVYGPEGRWLIEGRGVEPDIVMDNLPHATFGGQDAQLETAVKHLLDRIAEEPMRLPKAPPYPDKSFGGNKPKR
jgi:tricorn protease